MWFTNLKKQLSEKKFNKVEDCDAVFISYFSMKLFSKEEITDEKFKGKAHEINKALELRFNDITKVFDKNKSCLMVLDNDKKYNIKSVDSSQCACDEESGNDYLNQVFAELSVLVPDYINANNEINNGNNDNVGVMGVPRCTKLVLEETNETYTIINNVGTSVKEKFQRQDEIRFKVSLHSAISGGVRVKNIKRVEVFLSNDVVLKK